MRRIFELREKAKAVKRTIVLPEGNDARVVKAASFLAREGIADICLLGNVPRVRELASENSIALDGVDVLDPSEDAVFDAARDVYYELRKHKGVTLDAARETLKKDPVIYGAIMTRMERADGFVAGAANTTSSVVRAAIQCFDIDKKIGTVSSSFIVELADSPFGENGLFVFGDCAVVPFPSSSQLAGIAIASSDTFRGLFGAAARVAMLSYSTKGSAKGEAIDRIVAAVKEVKEKRPDILIDGEIQVDAALVPEVARLKCPGSDVAGRANVLIFPNLESGNISYKLVQRLGKARAVGPILQGVDKPASDLSRGCSWEDVVDAVAVTAVRARERKGYSAKIPALGRDR